jgi:hypothetical protein
MKAVCLLTPGGLTEALTPLVKVLGNDPWTNVNFVAGDLTVNGLIGNGSSKYLNTGVVPSAIGGANPFGLSYYTHTDPGATGFDNGSTDNGTGGYGLVYTSYSGVGANMYCWLAIGPVAQATWTGYASGNRVGSNGTLFQANSGTAHFAKLGPVAPGGTAPSVQPIYVFCLNSTGAPVGYVAKRFSFVALHEGLNASESQSLYNAVQALRTALVGGYV